MFFSQRFTRPTETNDPSANSSDWPYHSSLVDDSILRGSSFVLNKSAKWTLLKGRVHCLPSFDISWLVNLRAKIFAAVLLNQFCEIRNTISNQGDFVERQALWIFSAWQTAAARVHRPEVSCRLLLRFPGHAWFGLMRIPLGYKSI